MNTAARPSLPAHIDVFSPAVYADETRLHADLAHLRRHQPISWVDREPYRPFWLITRNEDVKLIGKNADIFINAPRLTLIPSAIEEATLARNGSRTGASRTLLDMDAPEHAQYREIAARWFIGSGLRKLTAHIETIAENFVQRMVTADGKCDFASDIAVWYPLEIIASLLGAPLEDAPFILRMTQALLASGDPELQQAGDYGASAFMEFSGYLGKMLAERQARPTDDLTSAIANATIGGQPIGMVEALSYVLLVITAGHDTTSGALAGGMLGFATHPGELAKLQADPGLMRNASNEICRWVSPVRHFLRTATEDFTLRDITIRAGESALMIYPSANRDEAVFDDPDVFRVDRNTSGHVAFGYGAHACIGRQLALLEMDALFSRLAPRLQSLELDGPPVPIASNFVGGYRKLPIRYTLR
ncbi:MAG: cytochrome P450 [Proteobacteria bacterium]|nr:cytochrome P450 [Pseudomonadota bacterium]HQR05075.1 cytochrome P450 [Rhodocyclaceae bacterium]